MSGCERYVYDMPNREDRRLALVIVADTGHVTKALCSMSGKRGRRQRPKYLPLSKILHPFPHFTNLFQLNVISLYFKTN